MMDACFSRYVEYLNAVRVFVCRYPHMRVCSQLVDAHLYILKKWTIDYLKKNKQVSDMILLRLLDYH